MKRIQKNWGLFTFLFGTGLTFVSMLIPEDSDVWKTIIRFLAIGFMSVPTLWVIILLFLDWHEKISTSKYDFANSKDKLENIGLTCGEVSSNGMQVKPRRWVFFPVVPKGSFSMYHLVFAHKINELTKLGFIPIILIFDDYYAWYKSKTQDSSDAKADRDAFINALVKYGIKKRHILLESDFLKNPFFHKKLNNLLKRIYSSLTIKDVYEDHDLSGTNNGPYIRIQKIFFYMSFISILVKKYEFGFVLCGEDERQLWEKYSQAASDGKNGFSDKLKSMTILSIKSQDMNNNNWDNFNIAQTDSKNYKDIYDRVQRDYNNSSTNCGLFYLLDNIYLLNGNTITIEIDSNKHKSCECSNSKDLIDNFKKAKNPDAFIKPTTEKLLELFSKKAIIKSSKPGAKYHEKNCIN